MKEPAPRALRWAPHLAGGPVPVADLLDLQRERGANLLLTSGRALDQSEARDSAAAACDEGDDALAALKPGERLALNLTVSAEWLCRPALLNALLTELIEKQQFDTWHIRVQWPSRSWTQPTDENLLAGYRKLAQVADDEDRRLLLPQTGLTGWLMLAWGAAGFGTGPFGSNQAFLEPTGGSGGKPQVERYFERQLLHFVERTSRRLITSDPGYSECTCPYCRPLLARTAPRGRTSTPGSTTCTAQVSWRPGQPRPPPAVAGPTAPSGRRYGPRPGSRTARRSPGTAPRRTCVPGISSCRGGQLPAEHPAHRARHRAGAVQFGEPLGQELAAGAEHAGADGRQQEPQGAVAVEPGQADARRAEPVGPAHRRPGAGPVQDEPGRVGPGGVPCRLAQAAAPVPELRLDRHQRQRRGPVRAGGGPPARRRSSRPAPRGQAGQHPRPDVGQAVTPAAAATWRASSARRRPSASDSASSAPRPAASGHEPGLGARRDDVLVEDRGDHVGHAGGGLHLENGHGAGPGQLPDRRGDQARACPPRRQTVRHRRLPPPDSRTPVRLKQARPGLALMHDCGL